MCYCIKGFQKCVVKKCAPLIKGCLPKVPADGTCCPTSYDCIRSMKIRRQVRQNEPIDDDENENDSIDFFSLLFGSDEPQEEVKSEATVQITETTTVQPFKVLPTTEQSFFDFIRAGLEIIDKNADKFSSVLSSNFSTTSASPVDNTKAQIKVENFQPTTIVPTTTTGKTPLTSKSTTKISSSRTTPRTTIKTSVRPTTTTTRKSTSTSENNFMSYS